MFILTLGTRGDLELFLALGRELGDRGHRVVVGTSEFYATKVREAHVEWMPVGNGSRNELVSILQSLASVPDKAERTYEYYRRWLRPQLAASMSHITSMGATTDYFISNLKMILQRGGTTVPSAAVTYDPPGAVEDLPKYGTQRHQGRILDLVAMNKKLVDPEDLWGVPYRFTGFWTGQQWPDWSPPADLAQFLDDGPPPVVITMGSMVMFDTDRLMRDITDALHLAAQRGVVVGGWSEISRAAGPVHFVSEAPYDWLFPKACCVIHHGGCGTVAAVLRAGKPSIVLPQITCQEHFGRMLTREKLATDIFDVDRLKPDDLAAAMHQAIRDEQFKQTALNWQKTVLEERGVETAADLIDAHWNHLQRQ